MQIKYAYILGSPSEIPTQFTISVLFCMDDTERTSDRCQCVIVPIKDIIIAATWVE